MLTESRYLHRRRAFAVYGAFVFSLLTLLTAFAPHTHGTYSSSADGNTAATASVVALHAVAAQEGANSSAAAADCVLCQFSGTTFLLSIPAQFSLLPTLSVLLPLASLILARSARPVARRCRPRAPPF